MKAFLFDLDGTLLDSIELILSSFDHTARTHLGEELDRSHWLKGLGTPLRDQLRHIAESPDALPELLKTYIDYNLEKHDDMARPYPGIVEVVRELHQRPVKLALVTSKLSKGAGRGLRLLGLEDQFDVRICADDVERGKPDPEPVLKALDALGVAAADAVFVGDSPHDIEAGRRAGVATAVVSWGPFPREKLEASGPDYWIDEPVQLLDL